MEIKNLYDKVKKPILYGGLGLATILGTFGGNEEGLTPFHNKKVGTSYGINISGVTEFTQGSKFYGINLSGGNSNQGAINGLNLAVITNLSRNGRLNGLEMSILANGSVSTKQETGKDNNLIENASEVNGLQIGLVNGAKAGNCLQVGVYNSIKKSNGKAKRSLLLNYNFKGKSRK